MSYVVWGDGSATITAEGYGYVGGGYDFSNCHRKVVVSATASGTTLSYTITSYTNTSSDNPKTQVRFYVNGTLVHDSGYDKSTSEYPRKNGSTYSNTCTIPSSGNPTIEVQVGISKNGGTQASDSGTVTRTTTTYYGVTFDLAGGSRTGGGEIYQEVKSGGSITPPNVSKSGYTFGGWSGSYTNVTSDRTITATWVLATASFNLNILLPDGSEPYTTGEAGSIEFSSDGGSSYTKVFNEPNSSYNIGTIFKFKNFKPGVGLKLDSISGATLGSDGIYTATLTSSGLVVDIITKEREPQDVYIDNDIIYARAFIIEENLTTVEIDTNGNVYASNFNPSTEINIIKGDLYAIDFIEGLPN